MANHLPVALFHKQNTFESCVTFLNLLVLSRQTKINSGNVRIFHCIGTRARDLIRRVQHTVGWYIDTKFVQGGNCPFFYCSNWIRLPYNKRDFQKRGRCKDQTLGLSMYWQYYVMPGLLHSVITCLFLASFVTAWKLFNFVGFHFRFNTRALERRYQDNRKYPFAHCGDIPVINYEAFISQAHPSTFLFGLSHSLSNCIWASAP